ncbi:uncharacterized protein PITG_21993 [Phytophthora infestans T30-4]|uniref:Uncharacterized protein n=2 Tax=Phytophthora infestans TaxID=4787 RepID=D0RLT0_PHYIT|nr:uncharacterized protein PITG_21993 [Phytophthora infestans T30-4]EEY69468.1 conserved hypothetical protein [Phytophthora infestans T30-4]KAF4030146.1 hypothetical protein GN244_ATG18094 [Phytophthora infestans]|eukprot:XP_002999329.1 conserved hypothetical protein [Phytophthora infestans T30-4]
MSLGFLTESALVPSKAKEIKVDAKSLVDLKAVVFQKDQERKRRLQDALTAENDEESSCRRLGKYAHLRGGSKRRKRSDENRVGKNYRNRGVDARNQRDEAKKTQEAPDEGDDEAWSKKSAEMLRKKTKLYEEMANGGNRDFMKGECLVNFEAKKKLSEEMSVKDKKTMVEIMDEFGRTRNVATGSEEYAAFLGTQQQFKMETSEKQHRGGAEDNTREEGSFVVSQWEKRLKSTEKRHLKEVHERATLAQSLAHPSLSGVVDKKTREQLRLERLRKQREEVAGSTESATYTSTMPDSAASEKATDFLNQLSSLM